MHDLPRHVLGGLRALCREFCDGLSVVRLARRVFWRGRTLLVLLPALIACGGATEVSGPEASASHTLLPGSAVAWPAASPAASKDGRADRPPPSYNLDTFIAVDNPRLVGPGASTLEVDDLVLGYERDGVARAFPVGMVSFHHIINDTVNGKPLLVTF